MERCIKGRRKSFFQALKFTPGFTVFSSANMVMLHNIPRTVMYKGTILYSPLTDISIMLMYRIPVDKKNI